MGLLKNYVKSSILQFSFPHFKLPHKEICFDSHNVFKFWKFQFGAFFAVTLGSPVAEPEAEAAASPTADADAEADPHLLYYGNDPLVDEYLAKWATLKR